MESGLTLSQFDLEAEVGSFAGHGLGERFGDPEWPDDVQRDITRAVKSGLRLVYFTQELPGIPGGYSWSFLQPTSEIAISSGVETVPLPDDFGGILGDVIPIGSSGTAYTPVPIVGPGQLYQARALSSTQTGRPTMAMIEPLRGTTPQRGNRYQMRVWPIPDGDYTANVWYYLLPNATSDSLPFVYGGAAHAETFKAACRASWELDMDNTRGPEWERFVERLRTSIAIDRRNKPLVLGPNLDRSDGDYDDLHNGRTVFTVNGVTPG